MGLKSALIVTLALTACSAATHSSNQPTTFIAESSDFVSFQSWLSFQLPDSDPLSDLVYPTGSRKAFLSARPPRGATRYPVGTIIVKAIERGATPRDWEVFALAKRGGDYNPTGAVDWEFFFLSLDANGAPQIASRGVSPADDGHGDMSPPPAAGGYFSGGSVAPCNVCHGQPKNAANDYILGTQLTPASTAQ